MSPLIPHFESTVVAPVARGRLAAIQDRTGAVQAVPRALAGFGEDLRRMGSLLAEVEIVKNEALNEIEAQNSVLGVQATVEEGIRGLERDPDPRTHSQRAMQLLKDSGEEALSQATNDSVRQSIQKRLNPFALEVFRSTRKFENQLLDQEGRVSLFNILDRERRQAAEALDPRDAEASVNRGVAEIRGAQRLGLLNPEQALQLEKDFRKGVRLDRAGQELHDDPEGFLERLPGPAFADLTPDEKLTLTRRAETRMNQLEAERRRREAEEERETRRIQEANASSLLNRIAGGEDVSASIKVMAETREISLEQQRSLLEMNMAPRERIARPSDPGAFQRLALDVHSTSPKATHSEIDRLVREGTLNLKDGLALKDRLTINQERMKSNPDLTRRHNQAEQILMNGLTTRSPLEALDPVSQKLKTQALLELTRRSSLFDGNEDPLVVVREVLPHYQKAFEDEAKLEEENIRKLLLFGTPQELEAARSRLPAGTYEAQRKLFLDLDKRIQERGAIQDRRKESGVKPPPGPFRP